MNMKWKAHWSRRSVYAVARAIGEHHGVDWDQAFRMAWYAMRANDEFPTRDEALARMQQVECVPEVPGEVFRVFQANLRRILKGG